MQRFKRDIYKLFRLFSQSIWNIRIFHFHTSSLFAVPEVHKKIPQFTLGTVVYFLLHFFHPIRFRFQWIQVGCLACRAFFADVFITTFLKFAWNACFFFTRIFFSADLVVLSSSSPSSSSASFSCYSILMEMSFLVWRVDAVRPSVLFIHRLQIEFINQFGLHFCWRLPAFQWLYLFTVRMWENLPMPSFKGSDYLEMIWPLYIAKSGGILPTA